MKEVLLSVALLVVSGQTGIAVDLDGDGMSGAYESLFRLDDHNYWDADENYDDDSLSNYEESLLGTDPNERDTDIDSLDDDEDDDPLSRAVMIWGDSNYIFNDDYCYAWPEWMWFVWKEGGSWSTDGWCVPANSTGRISIVVQRDLIDDLVLDLYHQNYSTNTITVGIGDGWDTFTNVAAFVSQPCSGASFERFALPLSAYDTIYGLVLLYSPLRKRLLNTAGSCQHLAIGEPSVHFPRRDAVLRRCPPRFLRAFHKPCWHKPLPLDPIAAR